MVNRAAVSVAVIHSLLGDSANFYSSVLNPLEPIVIQFANRSFTRHYGVVPSPVGLSILWSLIASSTSIGAFIGAILIRYSVERFGGRCTVMV